MTELEDSIMLSNSSWYEYLLDTRVLNGREAERERLLGMRRSYSSTELKALMLDGGVGRLAALLPAFEKTLKPTVLLGLVLLLPLVTLCVTYRMTAAIVVNGTTGATVFDEKGYFISASIDRAPASNLGTLGLSLTLSAMFWVCFIRHKIVKKQLIGHSMLLHRTSYILSIISISGGFGIVSYQHHLGPVLHNFFALVFFVGGVSYVIMDTFLDYYYYLCAWRMRLCRAAFAVAVVASLLLFLFFMGRHMKCMNSVRAGDGRCTIDEDMPWRHAAAAAEIAMFVIFISFFATYWPSFSESYVELSIVRRSKHGVRRAAVPLGYAARKAKKQR
eukprot:g2572.t1